MTNVLITKLCNRRCVYCFGAEKVHRAGVDPDVNGGLGVSEPGVTHMARDQYLQVIAFAERSGSGTISLLGGEPTLHPDFTTFVDLASSHGLNVRVFSNGLMKLETAEFLARTACDVNVIVNVNAKSTTPDHQWEWMETTLSVLGARAGLGFNIYRRDCDLGFMLELVLRHGLKRVLRVGLAMPTVSGKNHFLPLSDYQAIGRKLADFTDLCSQHNLVLALDCGFTLCMFSENDIGRMFYNGTQVSLRCDPAIDIGPDLTVWPCFPLAGLFDVSLAEVGTDQQLACQYADQLRMYKSVGALDECLHCPHLQRGQCPGGCVAHTIRAFRQGTSAEGV